MEERVDAGLVGLQTVHQVLLEAGHAIGQDAHAVQQVADHEGLEHVELELTVHAADSGSDVVTHDLGADHGKGLALSGVNLAGHDGRARLVLGEDQFTKTAAGTGSKVTDVLGNLEQRAGQGVQGTGSLDNRVVGGQNLELVGGSLELGAGQLGDLSSDSLVEALEGVQTSTDGGTTLSQVAEVGDASLDTLNVAVELSDVAGELLTEGERGGVLQVSTTDLDDLVELLNLDLESIAQAPQGRQEGVLQLHNGSNVHSGREGVIGGGGHVDVVVGVDGLLGALLAAQDLNGAVGDDLVRVHVGLGTGTGLPDDEGEVVHQLALRNLGGSLLDGLADLGV